LYSTEDIPDFPVVAKLFIIHKDSLFLRLAEIRNTRVFSSITDINEALSLTNEPQTLLNTALDTLSDAMGVECCWIQTLHSRKHTLSFVANRGFTPEMQSEIKTMNPDNSFNEQIIGMGQKIVIPDLSNDGMYGLSSFRDAGYKWLIAVPLMTYRVHGLLGMASRKKKQLQRETPDLALVIAGLIGSALNRSYLFQKTVMQKKSVPVTPEITRTDVDNPVGKPVRETNNQPDDKPVLEIPKEPETESTATKNVDRPAEDAFHQHSRKMERFRRSHQ